MVGAVPSTIQGNYSSNYSIQCYIGYDTLNSKGGVVKACPFCGKDMFIMKTLSSTYTPSCKDEYCVAGWDHGRFFKTKTAAIKAGNRRIIK
jgi:hypothetical protein